MNVLIEFQGFKTFDQTSQAEAANCLTQNKAHGICIPLHLVFHKQQRKGQELDVQAKEQELS